MANNELENFKNLKTIWKNTFDKILEIKIANKRLLEISKKQIFSEEKKKIDHKYEKQYKDEVIKNKIALSEKKNESNLTKIKRRNELIDKAVEQTKEKLKTLADSGDRKYIELLKSLIIQGMTQMLEDKCVLRIRQKDQNAVSNILNDCEREYSSILKDKTGREYNCKLEIDTEYLDCVYGGVHIFDHTKKIQCTNDLESRLELCYSQVLPKLKHMMFDKKE